MILMVLEFSYENSMRSAVAVRSLDGGELKLLERRRCDWKTELARKATERLDPLSH